MFGGQRVSFGIWFSFHHGFQGLNSSHETCATGLFPSEPSFQPKDRFWFFVHFIYLIICCVGGCIFVCLLCIHATTHNMYERQRKLEGVGSFLLPIWFSRIKLKVPGLPASAFTYWALMPATKTDFKINLNSLKTLSSNTYNTD